MDSLGFGPRSTTISFSTSNVPSGLCVRSSSFSSPINSSTRSLCRCISSSSSSPSTTPLFFLLLLITVPSNLNLKLTLTPSRNAPVSVSLNPPKSNLVKNPKLPSAKLNTGGTIR